MKKVEKFVGILPMNLRQFVISMAHLTFIEVAKSVKTYVELFEVDTVSHIFKNVYFKDVRCSLCHKHHNSLECRSLRFMIGGGGIKLHHSKLYKFKSF